MSGSIWYSSRALRNVANVFSKIQTFAAGIKVKDDQSATFGDDSDYSLIYSSTNDTLQIVDGSTVDTNIRAEIDNSGNIEFFGNISSIDSLRQVNLLTNSGFGVWSNSTLENVGSNLLTSWTNSTYETFTSSAADITSAIETGTDGSASSNAITLTSGKLYKIVATLTLNSGQAPSLAMTNLGHTTAALSAGANTFVREATDTTTTLTVSNTAASDYSCIFTFYEATPGCVAADSKSHDGWFKDSTLDIYREHQGTNTKNGSFYALKCVPSATDDYLFWPKGLYNKESFYQKFAEKTITFGAWVKTSTANHVRLRFSNNVFSSYHTGGGDWEWLEASTTLGSSPTLFSVSFRFAQSSGIAYISQPMLVFGSAIGEGNYVAPQGEIILVEDSFSLTNYDGDDTVSADADINLEVQSDGKIPKGAKAIYARLTGECATAEKYLQLDDGTSTIGTTVYSQVTNILNSGIGWVPCDSNGDIDITRDDTFANVKIDISGIKL